MIVVMGFFQKRYLLAFILVVCTAFGFWFLADFAHFCMTPVVKGSSATVLVWIPRGMGAVEVTKTLEANGVLSEEETSAKKFIWLGKLTRQWKKLKAGEYRLSPSMSPVEILSMITSGKSVQHFLTIREGENIFEIATLIDKIGLGSKEKFILLSRDKKFLESLGFSPALGPSLEGYLFPDTYHVTRLMSPEEMVQLMVKQFQAFWNPAHDVRARALGMSRHAVVTLASIIEKETGASQERAMISSVFHNRLQKKMRLQSDPTTIYGIWERFQGNLRKEDLMAWSPFNTYVIPGLPIGPIGNPGTEAIEAALYPAESDYLFFVSHNDGTHEFTKNYSDHLKAVRRFQMDPKSRIGKSWRDFNRQGQGLKESSNPK